MSSARHFRRALPAAEARKMPRNAGFPTSVWLCHRRITSLGVLAAAAAQWIANVLVATAFPPLAGSNLGLAYSLFTVFTILFVPFVIRHVRETKGLGLEEMAELEAGGKCT
ncbi:MAG: MFS transporter [Actinomycetota bacterium]|nr:MFS transporter [Actinomycetota bacterium]